jgi:hypothetical protein
MATLSSNITGLVNAIGADIKSISSKQGTLESLTTTQKTNLVAAINELKSEIETASGIIDDDASGTAADTSVTWSAYNIKTKIDAAIHALVDSAPDALDTLNELADALSGQDSAVQNLLAAVGNRVRFDAAQTLTSNQLAQAWSNLDLGDLTTNFSTVYENAKA